MTEHIQSVKILHIITGLKSGGAETVLYRLASSQKEQIHVVASLSSGGYYTEKLRDKGVRVYELEFNVSSVISEFRKLIKILHYEKPDIIQSWLMHADLVATFASYFCKNAVLFWNIRHSNHTLKDTKFATWFIIFTLIVLSRLAPDRILTCANSIKSLYVKYGMPSHKFEVIYNGIDKNKNISFKKSRSNKSERFKIAFVARVHPQKDHGLFFRVFDELIAEGFNIEATLAGQGTEQLAKGNEQKYKGLISILGETEKVDEVMSKADILILPSKYGEGFPNVLIEAMSLGTPCISSESGDAKFVIHDTGWTFKPGDSSGLKNSIISAYDEWASNSDDYIIRKQKAIARITQHFSSTRMLLAYTKLYSNYATKIKKAVT